MTTILSISIGCIIACIAVIGYLEEVLELGDDLTGNDCSGYI